MRCPACRLRELPAGAKQCALCAPAAPEPAPPERRPRRQTLLGFSFAAVLAGCTATGGSCTSDDSCTPLERCDAGRCEPPRPRPAPKGNTRLPEPPLPGKTPGGGPSKNVPLKDEV